MKKIISKTQLLILVLVLVFAGCQKQENNVVQNIDKGTDPIEEYYINIDSLSLATGVDIRELSNHESIIYFANIGKDMLNVLDKIIENPSKNATLEEQLPMILSLNESIQTAYNNSDYELTLNLCEILFNIFSELDEFSMSIGANGIQTITFNQISYNLPVLQIEEQQTHAIQIQEYLDSENSGLSQEVKTKVIECATYLSLINEKEQGSPTACRKKANQAFDQAVAFNTAAYIVSSGLCLFSSPFLMTVCAAFCYAGYQSAMASEANLYKTRMRLCDLQGYY